MERATTSSGEDTGTTAGRAAALLLALLFGLPGTSLAETLAYYKVPSHVEFLDHPLPRNATGKVLKQVLSGEAESTFVEE